VQLRAPRRAGPYPGRRSTVLSHGPALPDLVHPTAARRSLPPRAGDPRRPGTVEAQGRP